jgi:hypothetical protein
LKFLGGLLLAALALQELPLSAQQTPGSGGQVMGENNRILWIFPNYKTVDEEKSAPTITAKDKLEIALKDSFDPYAFPVAGIFAGVNQWEDAYPSWGRGWSGYGDRYLGSFADQTLSNGFTEAVFPIILHQDPRYLRLARGGIFYRLGYAVSRIFVTRSDSGEAEFNYSEFGGNAAMAASSNLYYPRPDRTFDDTAIKWGFQIGFDMLSNIGKEFWPDVKRELTGKSD